MITNNHFQGKAIANALQLISILRGSPVPVPESLREHYPQLAGCRNAPSEPTKRLDALPEREDRSDLLERWFGPHSSCVQREFSQQGYIEKNI